LIEENIYTIRDESRGQVQNPILVAFAVMGVRDEDLGGAGL
jgi:hypothetical protein